MRRSVAVFVLIVVAARGFAAHAEMQPVSQTLPLVFKTTLTAGNKYFFTFRLFDAESGGTEVWTETTPAKLKVSSSRTVQWTLGSVVPFSDGLAGPVEFSQQLWVQFTGGGKTPARLRLPVVPYALWSPASSVPGPPGEPGPKGEKGDQGPACEPCPLAGTGAIAGRIRCGGSDAAIGGVLVYVPGTSFSAVTDDAGNFSLSYLPAGSYRVNVSWPSVAAQVPDVQVQAGAVADLGAIAVACGGCSGKPDGSPCDDEDGCRINDKCVNGICIGTQVPGCCPPGQSMCGGGCVDTAGDPANCGGCGLACSADQVSPVACLGGECTGVCADGYADCNGEKRIDGCEVDLAGDAANCGACGNACAPGNVCQVGSCVCTDCCPPGQTWCGGGCVDTAGDPANCGGCGLACSADHVDPAACLGGECTGVCADGYADCNGEKRIDGCEVDLASDAANCGACGNACTPGSGCQGGDCQ